ncbi:4-diphosphocytidyl-2-C-methyl-D-erythritol kinase [Thalassoglobus neptunius]|uniref:4-diphosphocytidyl-2-C-methyl-D-erythritol kinase n=1 Tax=Thalassoglobus neptunius TaxID=1938619 RepID=A0A5C5X4B0_9PLAN|nr:4-(cytidine 5'-diphospho)-2-C-methyl-D-erythritol kinase [Thalassoglobus neptunius]TWT57035.1 4-diphosphocytidyl-2-C-methyl-D-erythritol kinase [Thalassoglobus neptunius]
MRIHRQGTCLNVLAPAKLNLSLQVLGERPDGFHDLQTVMISVRVFDLLSFRPLPEQDIHLSVGDGDIGHRHSQNSFACPTDERNLIVQAARLIQSETGCNQGVAIHLQKRIPSEAGMGGGSSDAAATLVALNHLWGLDLSRERLHSLAARLGSDLNFFLDSFPIAICTGRGEKIEPARLDSLVHFVIVKPRSGLATGEVFRLWKQLSEDSGQSLNSRELNGSDHRWDQLNSPLAWSSVIQNSLQPAAESLNADVNSVLLNLSYEDGVASGMTGSGSACFGICRNARHARRVAARMQNRGIGRVWVTTSGV